MTPDIIGTMYDITDPDKPLAKPGWHVNTDAPIAGADAFEIFPESPSQVFSGNPPMHCYKFNSKEHADLFLNEEGM